MERRDARGSAAEATAIYLTAVLDALGSVTEVHTSQFAAFALVLVLV